MVKTFKRGSAAFWEIEIKSGPDSKKMLARERGAGRSRHVDGDSSNMEEKTLKCSRGLISGESK